MVLRATLTDAKIAALKPAKAGARYHVYDADEDVPGFGVRVTERGAVSFILYTRFSPKDHPSRAALGAVGEVTTDRARRKAEQWLAMLASGLDPRAEERELREAARQAKKVRRDDSFGAVAEAYLVHKARQNHRRTPTVEREVRRHLVSRWAKKPISEIKPNHVVDLVNEFIEVGKQRTAHDVFGLVRSIFNWAIGQSVYGLNASPCDRLKPSDLIGEKTFRRRVLTDDELVALWRATRRPSYPEAQLYRLLLLTGARLQEVAGARWREFDQNLVHLIRQHQEQGRPVNWARVPAEWKRWIIPEERFKTGYVHIVPLSDDACRVLETLPTFSKGDHLFSVATFGAKPVADFSSLRDRIDRLVTRTLRAMARVRRTEFMPPSRWVNHDIRRTVRTRLSELRVSAEVAELIVGHAKVGIVRVYNQYEFIEERAEALDKWARKLRALAEPQSAKVVKLPARRR